jgi:hypothetical protein
MSSAPTSGEKITVLVRRWSRAWLLTKTGKPTARFRMQTLENTGDSITLNLDGKNLLPLSFNSEMGRSRF